MKLSIIVPVYNMASDGKLEFCIRSLLNQTIEDYEIIAVNDASTDNSFEVLYALQEQQRKTAFPERLKVLTYEENLRQGGAKNVGIRESNAEWIGIVDSDDWVHPSMYEKLLKKADETGADVVCCDYSIVYEHTFTPGEVEINNTPEQMGVLDDEKYKKIILDSGSMVIKIWKRDMIVSNNLWYPEHMFYEDNCCGPLWLLHCKHFEKVDEPLYYYYQHNASTVHYTTKEKLSNRIQAMDLLIEKARALGLLEKFRDEFEYKYAELAFITTVFSAMQANVSGRNRLIRSLRKKILSTFPGYEKNPYFVKRMGAEEKKELALLRLSPILFLGYYDLLHFYRKVRYK